MEESGGAESRRDGMSLSYRRLALRYLEGGGRVAPTSLKEPWPAEVCSHCRPLAKK